MDLAVGDLLAFAGRGWTSRGIQLFTCSRFSHVAGVAFVPRKLLVDMRDRGLLADSAAIDPNWHDRNLIFESTTLVDEPCAILGRPITGVQAHDLVPRVTQYAGTIWRLRLNDDWRLNEAESRRLSAYLISKLGTTYDGQGAFLSSSRIVKHRWWASRADMSSIFCSELLAGALQRVGRLSLDNASAFNPANLVRELVRIGVYSPPAIIATTPQ